MDDPSTELNLQQSMEPHPRRATVKAAVKGTCTGTTTDKELCGTNCEAEPASSVLDGASITLYTCKPAKKVASSIATVVVIQTETVKIWLTTSSSTPATTTLPKSTTSNIDTMATAACGGTVRALSACPTQCPASAIPGGVGVIYSCAEPASTSFVSSTPTTVETSRATLALTSAASATSAASSPSTSSPIISFTLDVSTFETSFLSTVTANDPTTTKEASTSSTLSTLSTASTVENHKDFQQTSAGKAAIAASLISGLIILGLAIFLWRRHRRMVQARDRAQPEAVRLRCDTGASGSDRAPEPRRNLTLWEILTNTTREEYHAQQASELRQVDRARMTERYYRNKSSDA